MGFWLKQPPIDFLPKRIISTVPSQTELLSTFGLKDEVIGITLFCVHPTEWYQQKTRIGGTKQLHIDKIRHLEPDLILANKEENTKHQIEELAKSIPVYVTNVTDFNSALQMIVEVGEVVGKEAKAIELQETIRTEFNSLPNANGERVAYFIWQNPYMVAGGDTFISSMLSQLGFVNHFSTAQRYPEIDLNDINTNSPDFIFLSSEPYPFQEKHVIELQNQFPKSKVLLVDGEYFSWYGSRMAKAPSYFKSLFSRV